ncbi:MAG: insulinase family protein, partial [Gammaproteobacteria bacterium]
MGKTGFAHLFEHLMFNGTENYNDEYFKPLQEVGATSMNGTTDFDRTNYFQTVPTTALDLALWLESDRMGHLLGAVDQEKLDKQRGVVQNEKRQSENRPYGTAFKQIMKNVFPPGHPYSWMTIGSMEDLNAATLEDVQEWFRTYYGPNNATLVLAGDLDLATARERVERYFGDIPPGPPLSRLETWIPSYEQDRRMILEDRVPQARIYKAWAIPEWGTDESDWLSLADAVLTDGKTSRLYQRLVYETQVATDVGSFPLIGELAGVYTIFITAQPGQNLTEVEHLLDEEIKNFLEQGPTEEELTRVKTQARAAFVRSTERVGGFRGKSSILAEGAVFAGRADAFKDFLTLLETTEPEHLRDTAKAWLSRGAFVLEVHPYQDQLRTSGPGADRSKLPLPSVFPRGLFPELHQTRLENGLRLIVAERRGAPTVEFSLQIHAGYAADQLTRPGTANLAMSMLDEGTDNMDALQISEAIARLGAQLRTGANLDYSFVSLSALRENMDASLDIYADVILNPAFPSDELERLRSLSISAIKRE